MLLCWLLLHLGEHVVEAVQAEVPLLLEGADPVVDRLQRGAIDGVPALAADGPAPHQVDLAQDSEVLGHLRLGEVQALDQIADTRLTIADGHQDVAPARFGDGVEHVGCRCGS